MVVDTVLLLIIVAVPISRLPDLIQKSKDEFQKSGLHTTIVSHALDGNFRTFHLELSNYRWNNVLTVCSFLMIDCMINLSKANDVRRRNWFIQWLIQQSRWKELVPEVLSFYIELIQNTVSGWSKRSISCRNSDWKLSN